MVLLHKLLPKLKSEGRKVLIFSQVRHPPQGGMAAHRVELRTILF